MLLPTDQNGPDEGTELSDPPGKVPTTPCSRWLGILGPLVAFLFVASGIVVFYGAALDLPASLIDDALVLVNSDKLWSNWEKHGFLEALKRDELNLSRTFKPGATLLYAYANRLFHESRYAMHMMILLLLGVTACGIVFIPLLDVRRWSKSWPAGWTAIAGLPAGFLFLGAEVPGWSGLQSLCANWYRLHTSESLTCACTAVHGILLVVGLGSGRRSWRLVLLALSTLSLLVAGTFKVTAFAQLGPLFVLALILAIARVPGWKSLGIVLAGALVLLGGYGLFLRTIAPSAGDKTYTSVYSVNWTEVRKSWDFYRESLTNMYGVFYPFLLPAIAVRVICESRQRRGWREVLSRNAMLVYWLLGFVVAVAATLPWPYRLPRYLLPAHMMFCLALGTETMLQIQWARSAIGWSRWLLVPVGAAALLWLPLPATTAGVIVLALVARWRKHDAWAQGPLIGVFVVGLIYFGFFAWKAHLAMINEFVAREHSNAAMMESMKEHFIRKRVVGYFGDPADERIGSMVLLINRSCKCQASLLGVQKTGEVEGKEVILVENPPAHRGVPAVPGPLAWHKPVAEFKSEKPINRPINFWRWRRKLQARAELSMTLEALPSSGWTVFIAKK